MVIAKRTYDREKVKIEHKEKNFIEITKDDKVTLEAGSTNKIEIDDTDDKITLEAGSTQQNRDRRYRRQNHA